MAIYRLSNSNQMQTFPVSNIFIDKYMPQANATFVKVYLYGLRHCFSGNNEIDNKQVAKDLNILESDVVNAWIYWESVGAIKLIRSNNTDDFDIEFIDLPSAEQEKQKKVSRIVLDSRPNYSPEEISIYIEQDENIRYMYNVAQEKLGKMLSSSDISILYSLYDWLRLPVEVIVMLIEYCVSINKRNMRYIEKVAIHWADEGINTVDKVEQHLMQIEEKRSKLYAIKKCFGITDRQLTSTEENYILQWTDKMKFDMEMIAKAYELTILNTGKLSFPYLNSILQSWHEKGITTVTEVEKEKKQYKENNKEKYKNHASSKDIKRSNKFINFKQTKYNFEEIEKIALQKRLSELKEGDVK